MSENKKILCSDYCAIERAHTCCLSCDKLPTCMSVCVIVKEEHSEEASSCKFAAGFDTHPEVAS